ncbi:preprotein translocase subunit SecE [Leptotrichia sp. oral taxon 498]|jgi:preprotein translocase, secE subunit|uniref:preprotein translocase subunit SecE n=1 Tax=Leptotrichia sp. oral taxon 498 TaxID=712368 RepID=UPI000B8CD08D|nr:preprotein translocase subunit SecE [Leptotrichia sp. oral taxon 498]ASQ49260.1 preprotein translocase subunit SecE [Leptotrichia sp. oral taxon 498]
MGKFNLGESLKNLREEYKKIYWPNKKEVYHVTVIVILITIFIALYTLLFDTAFSFVLTNVSNIIKNFIGGA